MLKPERPTLELKKKKDFNINYFEFTGGWWIHWVCHTTRSGTQKGSQAGFWVFLYGCRLESIFIYQYKDTLNILYMHQKFNFIKVCKLCIFDNTWLNNTLMKVRFWLVIVDGCYFVSTDGPFLTYLSRGDRAGEVHTNQQPISDRPIQRQEVPQPHTG